MLYLTILLTVLGMCCLLYGVGWPARIAGALALGVVVALIGSYVFTHLPPSTVVHDTRGDRY